MATRIATSLPYTELEVATGNYDTSRQPIDRIVMHTMVGSWQAAAARFANPAEIVSAHYGVKLDGGLIHWLEETFTAYHAGNYTMNQRSIGIEHEDGGNYNGVRPDVLYESSAKLVADICTFYNIPIDRNHIIKHSEVIATGCPDALDIDRIVNRARDIANPPKPLILEGFSKDVGYNPTFEGQTVSVNGVTYHSIRPDGVNLVWEIEKHTPPQTPVESQPSVKLPIQNIPSITTSSAPAVETNPITVATSNPTPIVPTTPIKPQNPSKSTQTNQFLTFLLNLWKRIRSFKLN
jgi:hypothetical protein